MESEVRYSGSTRHIRQTLFKTMCSFPCPLYLFVWFIFGANAYIPPWGTVRLYRNGVSDTSQSWSSGIVQIYYDYKWGNICDDSSFGSDEADVICHQLGYTGASSYSNTSTSIWGTDPSSSVLSQVSCSSSSYLTITQCEYNTSFVGCNDNNDVIVTCYSSRIWDSPSSGDIRLTGGNYSNQGLLEVYCNGQWGTVCDDFFKTTEATIACRQLGYNLYVNYNSDTYEGTSSQNIWLRFLTGCSSSTDTCLVSCGSCSTLSITGCSHFEDISLECGYTPSHAKVTTLTTSSQTCYNSIRAPTGTVRLYRNGVSDTTQSWSSGIVQIYYDYKWGNICDDSSFGSDEADVICHQLGYTGASSYSNSGVTLTWGSDSSPTVMDSVSCSSSSYLTITQCSFSTDTYCDYSIDAIVTCYPTRIWDSPSPGDIRLTGGMYSSQGLLEVYCNGQWGTVCSSQFYRAQGTAACKQLGYNDLYGVNHLIGGSSNQSKWIESFHLSCSSSAICLTGCGSCSSSPIAECIYPGDATLQCRYSSSFARVSSTTTSDCQNGADYTSTGTVRLYRNGVADTTQSWSSGIVQVYYSYEWGNICDDSSFGSDEADVICHQLGYRGASSHSNTGSIIAWGTDNSSTVMDSVSCSSSSYLTITQCSFSTSISSSCTHNTDVIVSCYPTRIWSSPIVGDIRLTGGTYSNEGLLEVYCNGQWGTVCDDYFDSTDATVACKQLGYNYHTDYDHLNIRGDSSQSVWLHYLSGCSFYLDNCLASCGSCSSNRVTACTHSEDVTLSCEYKLYEPASTAKISSDCFTSIRGVPTGTVRLYRNGTADRKQSWSSGIVQIYYDDQWGNICDDSSFGSDEADVICHQLGYTGASSYSNTGYTTIYTMDNSSTLMDDVSCSSSSYLTITQCSFSTITKFGCGNTNDVIVTCYSTRIWGSPSSGDIRLTGGTYSSQGLLEVYCNGQWITVCDDDFYSTHATVACRQLGYNGYLRYNQLPLHGTSSQSLRMQRYVGCSSSDSCLTICSECSSRSSSCGHDNDVTLECEYSLSYSKVDTDASIDCDISTISESTIIGIATGSAIAFLVCIVCTVSIPICICVYLRVRVGTVGRSRGRPLTRVVSSSQPAYTSLKNTSSDVEEEKVPFINNAADNTGNDDSHAETPVADNEQQSATGLTASQPSGSVPPPTASGYPPPNLLQPAVAPVVSTSHPASVIASGQNPQQPTTNTSHSKVYSHAY